MTTKSCTGVVAGLASLAVILPMSMSAASAETTGTEGSVAVTQQQAAEPGTTADGRALFSGIFFGQGAAAKELVKLDSFSAMKEAQRKGDPHSRKASHAVLAEIQRNDPGFLAEFSAEVRSGDPFRVEQALLSGGEELAGVVERQGDDQPTQVGTCFWVVAVVTVVAAGNAAVAVNAVYAGNVAWTVNWAWSSPKDGNSLARERAVAEFTQLLAA